MSDGTAILYVDRTNPFTLIFQKEWCESNC